MSNRIFDSNGDIFPRDWRTAPKPFLKYYRCKEHGFIHAGDILWIIKDGEDIPCCAECRKPVMRVGDEE